jgi:hypothetical protein
MLSNIFCAIDLDCGNAVAMISTPCSNEPFASSLKTKALHRFR